MSETGNVVHAELLHRDGKALVGDGQIRIAKGTSVGMIGGLLHKDFVGDLYLALRDPARLEAAGKADAVPELKAIAADLVRNPGEFAAVLKDKRAFIRQRYVTCLDEVENGGHRFGEDLPESDKKALTAFVATL